MTHEANEHPDSSALWQEFDSVEAGRQQELEAKYQQIESYNATILNQTAGIEDLHFEIEGRLGEHSALADSDPRKLTLQSPFMSLMYLQPDLREDLIEQGYHTDYAVSHGDPHVIRGDVPERTQKLLADLMASTGAVKDEERSSENEEVWKGDVAGQPIEFDIRRNVYKISDGREEREEPSLTLHVVRPTKEDVTLPADDDRPFSSSVEDQINTKRFDKKQAGGGQRKKRFANIRRKIFPNRNKHN